MQEQFIKKGIVIGDRETTTLFKLFGFTIFNTNTSTLSEIVQTIEHQKPSIGIILIAANVLFDERLYKKIQSFDIPTITIPIHYDHKNTASNEMERLVEKAVGMKLQFMKK